jgi:hypothetical protein
MYSSPSASTPKEVLPWHPPAPPVAPGTIVDEELLGSINATERPSCEDADVGAGAMVLGVS